jgi:ubiquinone/menaquinone biosynthesis C-methylase UbiE
MSRKSEKRDWDRFGKQAGSTDDVYSNEGRVAAQIKGVIPVEGMSVLEVGAGTGRDGIELAALGAEVVSLDYSMPSLEMIGAQVGHGERVTLCCGDAFSLPFEEDTFDIVFHQGLLEHFRNPDDLIAENRRVLKPGGILLVDVPQRFHYYSIIKHVAIAFGAWFAGWETEFSVRELERLLEKHSFSIVTSYGEWFNPPIWYRMLRKAALGARIRLPMYPWIFRFIREKFSALRAGLLGMRWTLYTTVVIGTLARKE